MNPASADRRFTSLFALIAVQMVWLTLLTLYLARGTGRSDHSPLVSADRSAAGPPPSGSPLASTSPVQAAGAPVATTGMLATLNAVVPASAATQGSYEVPGAGLKVVGIVCGLYEMQGDARRRISGRHAARLRSALRSWSTDYSQLETLEGQANLVLTAGQCFRILNLRGVRGPVVAPGGEPPDPGSFGLTAGLLRDAARAMRRQARAGPPSNPLPAFERGSGPSDVGATEGTVLSAPVPLAMLARGVLKIRAEKGAGALKPVQAARLAGMFVRAAELVNSMHQAAAVLAAAAGPQTLDYIRKNIGAWLKTPGRFPAPKSRNSPSIEPLLKGTLHRLSSAVDLERWRSAAADPVQGCD